MAWVRFDDGFFRHPKVVTAGRDARDLFMASVFYANSNLTDGYIPEGAIRLIAADAGISTHAKQTAALLKVGLWLNAEDGYQIHDYLAYQQSATQVKAYREANAKRQEEWRNKKRNKMDNAESNAVTNTVTNAPVTLSPIPNPITTTNSDELVVPPPPPKGSDEIGAMFDQFWSAYPKKASKQAAIKAFGKVNWRKVDFSTVMAAIETQRRSTQWTKDNGEFIPYPATWLNGAKWEDELSTTSAKPTTKGTGINISDLRASIEEDEHGHDRARETNQEGDGDFVSGVAERGTRAGSDYRVLDGVPGHGLRVIAGRSG